MLALALKTEKVKNVGKTIDGLPEQVAAVVPAAAVGQVVPAVDQRQELEVGHIQEPEVLLGHIQDHILGHRTHILDLQILQLVQLVQTRSQT